jgi:transcription elongation factor Elf1
MGEETLANCPFCGSLAELKHKTVDYRDVAAWVECRNCEARTVVYYADAGYCADNVVTARWNSRTQKKEVE